MKIVFPIGAAGVMAAALCGAQPSYKVTDLGGLAGGFTEGLGIANNHIAAGAATMAADKTQQATIWGGPLRIDIGQPGLNSAAESINSRGQVAVQAETSAMDPNNENFCAFGTGRQCLPHVWERGVLTPLPTFGGVNGIVVNVNNSGQMVGVAETAVRDKQCATAIQPGGTGPQYFDYQAALWSPGASKPTLLAPLPGDTVGMAIWISDNGQAVGASGTCDNSGLPPIAYAPRNVMWDKNGTPHDLGNLGFAINNAALAINNPGQVVGAAAVTPDGSLYHAFLWTSQAGMQDLGTLSGDVASVLVALNNPGQATGESDDADGNARAILWQSGTMYDLNALAHNSPLYLLCALAINDNGDIVGFGATEDGDIHAYLATPANGSSASAIASTSLFDRIPVEARAAAYAKLEAMFHNGVIPGVRSFRPRRAVSR